MEEIFELIKAFNRLKEQIKELAAKLEQHLKSLPAERAPNPFGVGGVYLEEDAACRFLHVSPRTLARMRKDGSLPFVKERRRVLYKTEDLKGYLEKHKQ